jgi:hypothetical protein
VTGRRVSLAIAAVVLIGILGLVAAFTLPHVLVSPAASAPRTTAAAPPHTAVATPTGSPIPSTDAQLRARLLPPPAGATLLTQDSSFTFRTVPTYLVWETLNNGTFIRGVTRRWREADGTLVLIVLYQFTDDDASSQFSSQAQDVLAHGQFGCQGAVQLYSPDRGYLFGCNANSANANDSWRAEFYHSVFAVSITIDTPGPRGTRVRYEDADAQGKLLV